ncbi:MAG: serine/threonine-protein kinase [Minisyncoccia bacterium]
MNEYSTLKSRYKLIDKVGIGGMSTVYVARDLKTNAIVAIKVLHPQFAIDKNFISRFFREIKIISTLTHPNILKLYDYGVVEGTPYFVTEYIQGKTLKELLNEGKRFSIKETIRIIIEVLKALSHANSKGVIAHRDIKPGNIMIDKDGNVKLMDFGIAKFEGSQITQDTIMYTPTYASPEQIKGENVDIRSDLYSLGCTLYELLTGRPPFTGTNTINISFKHINEQPIPPSNFNKEISKDLDNIILKLLSKNPSDRYQTPEEVIKDLAKLTSFKKLENIKSESKKIEEKKELNIISQKKTFKKTLTPIYILIAFILVSLISFVILFSTKSKNSFFSTIQINTNPEKAEVYIDGIKIGLSPILNYKVSSGEHKIKVIKEGYEEKEDVVILKNNENKILNIDLNKIYKYYKLIINTEPYNAKVYIDDEFIGLSPLELLTPKNELNLKILKENYEDYTEKVLLYNESKMINVTLKEKKSSAPSTQPVLKQGKLSLDSDPQGADVYIDKKLYGKTPLNIDLKIGSYKVEIKKDGYLQYSLTVEIKENEEFKEKIALHPIKIKGRLIVNVEPSGALIYLNDEIMGHTYIDIEIDPGYYKLKIVKEGYIPYLEDIYMKAGDKIDKKVTLGKIPP